MKANPNLGVIEPSRYLAITDPVHDKLAVRAGFLVFLLAVEKAISRKIKPGTRDAEAIVDAFFSGMTTSEAALFLSGGQHADCF